MSDKQRSKDLAEEGVEQELDKILEETQKILEEEEKKDKNGN